MQINTFWKIVIKIIGLWLLLSSISLIPQFFTTLGFTNGKLDIEGLLIIWLVLFLAIIVYILIIRLFLFKTDWVIEKLQLEKNFTEERIDLNIKTATILTIAIIVMGGLILVESLPSFCSGLLDYYQQKSLSQEYQSTYWLIYHFIKIIIAHLLLTNAKKLASLIEKKAVEN